MSFPLYMIFEHCADQLKGKYLVDFCHGDWSVFLEELD